MAKISRFACTKPFTIIRFIKEEWNVPSHRHNFFELVHIVRGKGIHVVNGVRNEFNTDALFLLGTEDVHHFELSEETEFRYLKFTEQFLEDKISLDSSKQWCNSLLTQIKLRPLASNDIISFPSDRLRFTRLLDLLEQEFKDDALKKSDVFYSLFHAMMSIYMRNRRGIKQEVLKNKPLEDAKVEELLSYIRTHALDRKLMTVAHLSKKFHLSPAYIGIYVKKHTGHSLRHIITTVRMKRAETYLKNSSLTISEVAHKLGYSEVGHFSHQYKVFHGVRPSVVKGRVLSYN